MGLQATQPTPQVCFTSFNQCCGSAVLVSTRILVQILGLINVAYPDPGSNAFLCFFDPLDPRYEHPG
jgi:hypothetical protein